MMKENSAAARIMLTQTIIMTVSAKSQFEKRRECEKIEMDGHIKGCKGHKKD